MFFVHYFWSTDSELVMKKKKEGLLAHCLCAWIEYTENNFCTMI